MHTEKRRVVLDTNVAISAAISKYGPAADIFRLFLKGVILNYTSDDIVEEFKKVINRKKFDDIILPELKEFMLENLSQLSYNIKPEFNEKVAADSSDDKF